MDGGACWAAVHGVAKSQTRLSDFTFPFHFHALEKEMATHSSVLAWRIPGTGEPGGLPSMGLHRVGHDRSDLAAAATAVYLEKFYGGWFCVCVLQFDFVDFKKQQILKIPYFCNKHLFVFQGPTDCMVKSIKQFP